LFLEKRTRKLFNYTKRLATAQADRALAFVKIFEQGRNVFESVQIFLSGLIARQY